jgi:acyl-CoA thioesterase FadM
LLKAASYDQELTIKISVKQLPGIRIHFEYELFNEDAKLIYHIAVAKSTSSQHKNDH